MDKLKGLVDSAQLLLKSEVDMKGNPFIFFFFFFTFIFFFFLAVSVHIDCFILLRFGCNCGNYADPLGPRDGSAPNQNVAILPRSKPCRNSGGNLPEANRRITAEGEFGPGGNSRKQKRRGKSFVEVVELSSADVKLWLAGLGGVGKRGPGKVSGKNWYLLGLSLMDR